MLRLQIRDQISILKPKALITQAYNYYEIISHICYYQSCLYLHKAIAVSFHLSAVGKQCGTSFDVPIIARC